MESVYDCQACGACCFSDREVGPGYVVLDAGDQERLRRLGLPLVEAGDAVELATVASFRSRRGPSLRGIHWHGGRSVPLRRLPGPARGVPAVRGRRRLVPAGS